MPAAEFLAASADSDHPARVLPVAAKTMLPKRLAKMLRTMRHKRRCPLHRPMDRKPDVNLLLKTARAKLGGRPLYRRIHEIRLAGGSAAATEPARQTGREPSLEVKRTNVPLVQTTPLGKCPAPHRR